MQISRMWCRAALAIGLAVGAAALAIVSAAQGAYPGRDGVLAVVSSAPRSGALGGRVDLIRLDGTRVRRIPCDGRCRDLWPVWSPTGRRLAFSTAVDLGPGGMRVATVRADGSRRRVLPSPAPSVDAVAPAWSPDSARIAFGAVGFDVGGIWSSDLAGGAVERLSAGGQQPAWSSGGTIAYSAGGPPEIWSMNSDGSGRKQLTRGSGERQYPEWSPRGTRIAYTVIARGRESVWIMRADGRRQRRLASGSMPAWSPDGRRIAFERGGRIYVMDAAGRDVCRIPYAPRTRAGRRMRLSLPDWQPLRRRSRASRPESAWMRRSEHGRVGSGNRGE